MIASFWDVYPSGLHTILSWVTQSKIEAPPQGVVDMKIGRHLFSALLATVTLLAVVTGAGPAHAQSVMEQCIQQGFKPGTAGFYRCLQETSGSDGENTQDIPSGDAGSILNGDPQDAVSDYSGSTMDGATAPDPSILKQFNPGGDPNR